MAALDFPSSPTVGQQYAAPNGVTYQWDGAVWVVTGGPPGQLWTGAGATLTPTDTTKIVALAPVRDALQGGTTAIKGRLDVSGAIAQWTCNVKSATNVLDDTTKPAWAAVTDLGADTFAVWRAPATAGTAAFTRLMALDNAGDEILPGTLTLGPGTVRGILQCNSAGDLYLTLNNVFAPQDTTKPSWMINTGSGVDTFVINRRPANGAAGVGTNVLVADASGNLTISGATATKASGTTWANPSDIRLKKNIAPYMHGLAAVVALAPKTFEFNGLGGSQDGMPGIGLIAQDVEPVMPEMVSTTPTKLAPDDAEPVDLLMLDTTALAMALVNAVKELSAEVAALKAAAVAPTAPPNA